ncbi:hypothetical protein CLU79DRAFT_727320 [Phycomyces nitens]|nr:hypothetical protein CLU79DRAFT_727320 [Phycomyces nitens]
MGMQVVDYRVSTLVVLCKDCGSDVGLYPARHKCQDVIRPAMPTLPTKYANLPDSSLQVPRKTPPPLESSSSSYGSSSTSTVGFPPSPKFSSSATSETTTTSKWSRFGKSTAPTPPPQEEAKEDEEESIYFNKFAAHLPDSHSDSPPVTGKKLWGKVRTNEKWKQMNESVEKPKAAGKLWGKIIQATHNITEGTIVDEKGPESDDSDWEGESHVSRVLREHYEKKREALPAWLRDERTSNRRLVEPSSPERRPREAEPVRADRNSVSRRQRLWASTPENDRVLSKREQELQDLRQAQANVPTVYEETPAPHGREDHYSDKSYGGPKGGHSGDGYNRQHQNYNPTDNYETKRSHKASREPLQEDSYQSYSNYQDQRPNHRPPTHQYQKQHPQYHQQQGTGRYDNYPEHERHQPQQSYRHQEYANSREGNHGSAPRQRPQQYINDNDFNPSIPTYGRPTQRGQREMQNRPGRYAETAGGYF